ncbi:unknown (plasmid) [Haloarcula marismortui ATCC 43049]|jgi:hypothetical protein|uniref:Uncharacterized protein n=1 Tax=Haloarcula marismortui (strain ATCC 43049 / DSM 3752 / JCM 8966 / VKM B-1809) TaxID=272569 RepID=Q5V7J5_HALMA|nr:unknown [Haloarcula marismortui ATCC 43049]
MGDWYVNPAWTSGRELIESQRENTVVDDIHDLFENKWDWYDE